MADEKPTNKWIEICAAWDGADGYVGHNQAGATVLMGKDKDGKPGIGPMQMLLVGLAGCTMMDIVDILKKKRQMPVDFQVKVRGNQRLTEYPYHYTEFQTEYLLWGDNLKEKDVAQAIQLSEEKYVSVAATVRATAEIVTTFEILPE